MRAKPVVCCSRSKHDAELEVLGGHFDPNGSVRGGALCRIIFELQQSSTWLKKTPNSISTLSLRILPMFLSFHIDLLFLQRYDGL